MDDWPKKGPRIVSGSRLHTLVTLSCCPLSSLRELTTATIKRQLTSGAQCANYRVCISYFISSSLFFSNNCQNETLNMRPWASSTPDPASFSSHKPHPLAPNVGLVCVSGEIWVPITCSYFCNCPMGWKHVHSTRTRARKWASTCWFQFVPPRIGSIRSMDVSRSMIHSIPLKRIRNTIKTDLEKRGSARVQAQLLT